MTSMIASASDMNLTEKVMTIIDEKEVSAIANEKGKPKKSRGLGFFNYWVSAKDDVEKNADGASKRPVRLFAAVYGGFAAALSICESSWAELPGANLS